MKFTPAMAGAMSGSLGGITASRNRGGQYFRRRAVPVNPDSDLQVDRRATFASLISAWNNILSEPQRQSWRLWAANTPRTDSLGQTKILTGQNAFVGYNTLNKLSSANTLVAGVYGPYNRGETTQPLEIEYDALDKYSITNYTPIAPTADGFTLIFVGRNQNPSVTFYKGPWRFLGEVEFNAGIAPVAYNFGELNTLPFPAVAGNLLPVRMVNIFVDGRYTDASMMLLAIPEP